MREINVSIRLDESVLTLQDSGCPLRYARVSTLDKNPAFNALSQQLDRAQPVAPCFGGRYSTMPNIILSKDEGAITEGRPVAWVSDVVTVEAGRGRVRMALFDIDRKRSVMVRAVPVAPLRVVVFINENKTTDFAFRSMAGWGADVIEYPPSQVLTAAPDHDQPHDRNSWVHYRTGDYPAVATQLDNDSIQPFHAWLAKTFVFSDHHFGIGSNSTSGHMLAVGGQTPTLKNPPFGAGGPTWDMPSIFTHAAKKNVTWAAVPDRDRYPVKFYTELNTPANAVNIHPTQSAANDAFIDLVNAGNLPQLTYAWGPGGADEHPPFLKSDPAYLVRADDLLWRRVGAVVQAGLWDTTVFIFTYDDWGGYADHVTTPTVETAIDAIHPGGFAIIGGSRLPLIMFGGPVPQQIDNTWHSHATILRTVIDLFKLPKFGISRVDTAPSLAGLIKPGLNRPTPPLPGGVIVQPAPPKPRPKPVPPPAWTGPTNQALSPIVLNGGQTLPAPADARVSKTPPKPPTPVAATLASSASKQVRRQRPADW